MSVTCVGRIFQTQHALCSVSYMQPQGHARERLGSRGAGSVGGLGEVALQRRLAPIDTHKPGTLVTIHSRVPVDVAASEICHKSD